MVVPDSRSAPWRQATHTQKFDQKVLCNCKMKQLPSATFTLLSACAAQLLHLLLPQIKDGHTSHMCLEMGPRQRSTMRKDQSSSSARCAFSSFLSTLARICTTSPLVLLVPFRRSRSDSSMYTMVNLPWPLRQGWRVPKKTIAVGHERENEERTHGVHVAFRAAAPDSFDNEDCAAVVREAHTRWQPHLMGSLILLPKKWRVASVTEVRTSTGVVLVSPCTHISVVVLHRHLRCSAVGNKAGRATSRAPPSLWKICSNCQDCDIQASASCGNTLGTWGS